MIWLPSSSETHKINQHVEIEETKTPTISNGKRPETIKQELVLTNDEIDKSSLSRRLFSAFLDQRAILATGSYSRQVCSKIVEIGARGALQTIPETGSLCEAFIARSTLMILEKLLDREMNVLEFSTGSSTLWYLLRVKKIVSVEHCKGWLDAVETRVRQVQAFLQKDKVVQNLAAEWAGHHGACNTCACEESVQDESFHQAYFNVDFLKLHAPFDVVSIDGRGRAYCLEQTIKSLSTSTPLLKKNGILILDNTQRKRYWAAMKRVPSHWPVVHFMYPEGERTTLWIRCGDDEDRNDSECHSVAVKIRKIQQEIKAFASIEIDVPKTW